MTMPIRTAAGNSRKREVNQVLRRYNNSGNDRRVQTQTLDVFGLRSYRNTVDVTGEHECMN